jgi:hypothetical protein
MEALDRYTLVKAFQAWRENVRELVIFKRVVRENELHDRFSRWKQFAQHHKKETESYRYFVQKKVWI